MFLRFDFTDKHHGLATLRTAHHRDFRVGSPGGGLFLGIAYAKEFFDTFEHVCFAWAEEAVIAHLDEAVWQDVL